MTKASSKVVGRRPPGGKASRSASLLAILATIVAVMVALAATPQAESRQADIVQGNQGIQGGWPVDDQGRVDFAKSVMATLPLMQEAGAGWVRINFRLGGCFTNWTSIGCNGKTALATYDQVVDAARAYNLQVLGVLSNEAWVGGQADWVRNNAEMAGGNGDNDYLRAFAQQAALPLARHFYGRVVAWEVWNEPNAWTNSDGRGAYWGGTFLYPSNFAWLLRHVYEDAHQAGLGDVQFISGGLLGHDSGGLVAPLRTATGISFVRKQGSYRPREPLPSAAGEQAAAPELAAAPTGESGADYLRATYDQGRLHAGWEQFKVAYQTYPLDGIGQHLYIDQDRLTTRENMTLYVNHVRSAYAAYEGAYTPKRIHMTEFGWETSHVSEAVQAANIKTAYEAFRLSGYVSRAYLNAIMDIPEADLYYGLTYLDGAGRVVKKLSFAAYQEAATYEARLKSRVILPFVYR